MESSYVDKASLVRWRDEEGSKTNAIAAKFSFLVAAVTLVLDIKESHCVFHAALEIIEGFFLKESQQPSLAYFNEVFLDPVDGAMWRFYIFDWIEDRSLLRLKPNLC